MLIDLLNTDSYVSYNVKIAEALGLYAAVYLTELININNKAYLKNKLDENKYFTVDRRYIFKRTTLDLNTQISIDQQLSKLKVLKIDKFSKDKLQLDLDLLAGLITGVDTKTLANLSEKVTAKKSSRTTQREMIIANLKESVSETNEELRTAYSEWIDSVYAKQNWMSKKSVTEGQHLINTYSNHDLDLALKILEIAATNAYRDMQWAINRFERDYKRDFYKNYESLKSQDKPCITNNNVDVTDEVF